MLATRSPLSIQSRRLQEYLAMLFVEPKCVHSALRSGLGGQRIGKQSAKKTRLIAYWGFSGFSCHSCTAKGTTHSRDCCRSFGRRAISLGQILYFLSCRSSLKPLSAHLKISMNRRACPTLELNFSGKLWPGSTDQIHDSFTGSTVSRVRENPPSPARLQE